MTQASGLQHQYLVVGVAKEAPTVTVVVVPVASSGPTGPRGGGGAGNIHWWRWWIDAQALPGWHGFLSLTLLPFTLKPLHLLTIKLEIVARALVT